LGELPPQCGFAEAELHAIRFLIEPREAYLPFKRRGQRWHRGGCGKPRVDDRRVLSGIIFFNRNGLRWRDAPAEYGPHKTLYNRWKRWSDKGVFARIMVGLAAGHGEEKTVMIVATCLKAHRTATSMAAKKGGAVA